MPFKMSQGVLTALDIYGHPVSVNHKGQPVFKTRLGSLCTVLTYALILINLIGLVTTFRTKSDQLESSQVLKDLHKDT